MAWFKFVLLNSAMERNYSYSKYNSDDPDCDQSHKGLLLLISLHLFLVLSIQITRWRTKELKPIILVGTELLYNGPNVVAVVIKENGGKETWRLKTKDMEDL